MRSGNRSKSSIYLFVAVVIIAALFFIYRNRINRYQNIVHSRTRYSRDTKKTSRKQKKGLKQNEEKRAPGPVKVHEKKKRGFLQKKKPGVKRKKRKKEKIQKIKKHIEPSGYQELQRHFKTVKEFLKRPSLIPTPQKITEPIATYLPKKIKSLFNAHRGLPHQYRATPFWSEPRDATNWLTSFDVSISGYSTKEGYDANEEITTPLNIYGSQDLVFLGFDVPNCNPAMGLCGGLKLLELGAIPNLPNLDSNFGKLKFNGTFKTIEANISFIQNIGCRGFFTQIHFPIRKLEIKDINPPTSLTPASEASLHNLQIVIDTLDLIMDEFNLAKNDFCKTGIGDVSVIAGWAYNSCHIDLSTRVGFLVPTGMEKDQNEVFSLPFGYDGHFGGQVSTEFAIKPSDWCTLGAHGHVLFFGERTKELRVKTNENQNGFIKLALAEVKAEKGALFNIGAYLKLNPFTRGLAVLFGYSYARKNKDKLTPLDVTTFSTDAINSDIMLQGWNMHILHFMLDCRLGNEDSFTRPHLNIFFDYQLKGKHVFKTHSAGGTVGFDFVWYF